MLEARDASGTDDERRWFACYTRARHEKRVALTLDERGMESFLPLVLRESQWKDRKKMVAFPLFPSYVFGHFSIAETHRVLSIPGVSTIVRIKGKPAIIRDHEIDNVRRFAMALATTGAPVETIPFIAEGELVEVTSGPFAGVRGFVVEQRSRRRVLVGLEVIQQGFEIDIETRHLRVLQRTVA